MKLFTADEDDRWSQIISLRVWDIGIGTKWLCSVGSIEKKHDRTHTYSYTYNCYYTFIELVFFFFIEGEKHKSLDYFLWSVISSFFSWQLKRSFIKKKKKKECSDPGSFPWQANEVPISESPKGIRFNFGSSSLATERPNRW